MALTVEGLLRQDTMQKTAVMQRMPAMTPVWEVLGSIVST